MKLKLVEPQKLNPVRAALREREAFLERARQMAEAITAERRRLGRVGASLVNGDASVTLTEDSEPTQVWHSPLTGDRHVLLPPPELRLAFRIVRSASATGAFSLMIGPGLAALTDASQWCDVASDGSSYYVVASGGL